MPAPGPNVPLSSLAAIPSLQPPKWYLDDLGDKPPAEERQPDEKEA